MEPAGTASAMKAACVQAVMLDLAAPSPHHDRSALTWLWCGRLGELRRWDRGAGCGCWAVCLVALALLCVCLPCSACIAACCAVSFGARGGEGGGWGGGRERSERQVWCSRRRVASLSPVFVGDWGRGRIAGCFAALALLFACCDEGRRLPLLTA